MTRAAVMVSAVELAQELDDARRARPVLLDVRWRLGGPPGRQEFEAAHLPDAVYVDLDDELAGPVAPGSGRHPLPEVAALQRAARSWGVRDDSSVVVYDDNAGLSAARAWWLLRWVGMGDVRILDGGLSAWRGAGGRVVQGGVTPVPGDVTFAAAAQLGRRPAMSVLDADGAAELVAGGGLLLDARSAPRYRGEETGIDPVPGHIPGAVSAPTTQNLAADGTLRPEHELAERFRALGVVAGQRVGVYCGSGVTAAHEIAAMAVAGIEDVALYPGSYSQWATLPGRPVET